MPQSARTLQAGNDVYLISPEVRAPVPLSLCIRLLMGTTLSCVWPGTLAATRKACENQKMGRTAFNQLTGLAALALAIGVCFSHSAGAATATDRARTDGEKTILAQDLIRQAEVLIGKKESAESLINAAEYLSPGCSKALAGSEHREAGEWKPPAAPVRYEERETRDKAHADEDLKGGPADPMNTEIAPGESNKKPFKPEWDTLIQNLVKTPRYKDKLMNADAAKMAGICSAFPKFDAEKKAKFWSAWLEGIARTESGLKSSDYLVEKFAANNGSSQVSAGLLSMSYDDRQKGCDFKDANEVYNDMKNLECGLITMNVLWDSKPTALQVAQRYWSVTQTTLKGGKANKGKYTEFRANLAGALKRRGITECSESQPGAPAI